MAFLGWGHAMEAAETWVDQGWICVYCRGEAMVFWGWGQAVEAGETRVDQGWSCAYCGG